MMRRNSRGQTEQERLQVLEERLSEYLNEVYFKYGCPLFVNIIRIL